MKILTSEPLSPIERRYLAQAPNLFEVNFMEKSAATLNRPLVVRIIRMLKFQLGTFESN